MVCSSRSARLAIEGHFSIAIPDADLKPENFRTMAAIGALVGRLRGA